MMKSHTRGYIYALLAAFFFAFIAIIGKNLVTNGIHPFQLTLYQYGCVILVLGVYLLIKSPKSLLVSKQTMVYFALLGVIGSAMTNLFFYSALTRLNAGISSMLLFIYPVYVTLFFSMSKIRPISKFHYFSLVLAMSGAVVVLDVFSMKGTDSIIGILFGILSGVCYAFYNILADLKLKEESANVVNFFASVFGFGFTGLLIALMGIGYNIPFEAFPSIIVLAIFSGILPIVFIFKAILVIGAEKVSIVASTELPMTLLLAYFILHEGMNPFQLFGVLLIVGAIVILHLKEGAYD